MPDIKELDSVAKYVHDIFSHCGVSPSTEGLDILTETIAYKAIDTSIENRALYETIAKKHGITPTSVPRIIEMILYQYRTEFHIYLDFPKKRMTAHKFIIMFSIYIKMEYFGSSARPQRKKNLKSHRKT